MQSWPLKGKWDWNAARDLLIKPCAQRAAHLSPGRGDFYSHNGVVWIAKSSAFFKFESNFLIAFLNPVYCLFCLCLILILSLQPWRMCVMAGGRVAEWGPGFSRCSPSKHSPPRLRNQKLNIMFGLCVSETPGGHLTR